jgi:hypothetical protein
LLALTDNMRFRILPASYICTETISNEVLFDVWSRCWRHWNINDADAMCDDQVTSTADDNLGSKFPKVRRPIFSKSRRPTSGPDCIHLILVIARRASGGWISHCRTPAYRMNSLSCANIEYENRGHFHDCATDCESNTRSITGSSVVLDTFWQWWPPCWNWVPSI